MHEPAARLAIRYPPPPGATAERAVTGAPADAPGLRVRNTKTALALRSARFCSTFYCFSGGRAVPVGGRSSGARGRAGRRHSHHDDGVGLTWQLKTNLPAARHV